MCRPLSYGPFFTVRFLTIHTPPEFPRKLNMHDSREFLHFSVNLVLYGRQVESQLIPITKQTSLIRILEIPAFLAWLFTKILETLAFSAWWFTKI